MPQPRRQAILRVIHAQLPDTAPRLLQPLRHQLPCTLHLLERKLKLAAIQVLRNQIQLQRRAHKILCQRVMNLPRHAIPLRQHCIELPLQPPQPQQVHPGNQRQNQQQTKQEKPPSAVNRRHDSETQLGTVRFHSPSLFLAWT